MAVLTSTHNLYFEQKYENIRFFILKLSVFGGEIFNIFEQAGFRNDLTPANQQRPSSLNILSDLSGSCN